MKFSYELVVVDDGSSDKTAEIVQENYASAKGSSVKLLSLPSNEGKGSAVRRGMLSARGAYMLMADADAATDIADFDKLMNGMAKLDAAAWKPDQHTSSVGDCVIVDAPLGVAIGSRAHLAAESVAQRSFLRTVLMSGFHFFVSILCTSDIKDTQCGFKLFTRRAAHLLFSNLHLERWAFDIEIIQLCRRLDIPVVEVAVNWHEVDGSKLITKKLDIVTTSLAMLRDMLCVRLCYTFGIWKVIGAGSGSKED